VLFIVVAGFYRWRAICPLAAFGEIGRNLPRRFQRRVPAWMERGHLLVPFLFLSAMLVVRHVATNGDGRWISGLLIALALAALTTNVVFTGKTWCNFVCPVGFIERIYTDPASLRGAPNSQCLRCTACKKSCPDIDQENNYWRELGARGRRIATFAFPGIVFAFYWYFELRAGDWEAYFDGRWTRQPVTSALVLGPGFFFAPRIPAVVAAAATLIVCAIASFALFSAIEAAISKLVPGSERRRHLVLSLAAFMAFSVFYVFAGAPTLRRIPGGTRTFAFLTPAIAVAVLARRWNRTREGFVREKIAGRLTRKWPFAGEPPKDPIEAYAQVQATEQAREQLLAGYANTLADVLSDGIVDEGEARLLAEIRKQFGITQREHESVVSRLAEEDRSLLESGRFVTVEERLQLETYRAALTEALLRGALPSAIDDLRRDFGVSEEDHAAVLAHVRGGSGPLLERTRKELETARARRADREALEGLERRNDGVELLRFLLGRGEETSLGRVFDLLETVGDRARISALRPALASRETATRRSAFGELMSVSLEAVELADRLAPFAVEPPVPRRSEDLASLLTLLVRDPDPFIRAAAVWTLGSISPGAPEIFEAARDDREPLVSEAAGAALLPEDADRDRFAGRTRISQMQFLRGVPLFADLDPDDLLDLAELSREEELPPGAVLCEQDRPDSGDLFVILSGSATVLVAGEGSPGASEKEVAVLGRGEVVGELALVDGSPRSATVRPRGERPLSVLRIPARSFRERLLPRGRVARSLLLTLTRRLRTLTNQLSNARR
jgi:Cyclic nucleotide-binding domain/HEAT repeat